jgi:hypothetical protein
LSERLITTYEVVVTEKEAKHDKSNTPVTEVGGEMNNYTVTEVGENTIYNSANNTVTKFRELEMDKNTIYNSTAASMSEFSEVTSTVEDLKCKDKTKTTLRTWDQTLNDVETMLVYSVYFRRKEQQTFQKEEQKQTFFLSILLGRNCSGRGRLA